MPDEYQSRLLYRFGGLALLSVFYWLVAAGLLALMIAAECGRGTAQGAACNAVLTQKIHWLPRVATVLYVSAIAAEFCKPWVGVICIIALICIGAPIFLAL